MLDAQHQLLWPFLVGRSLRRPIEVVVAPRPIVLARMEGLLGDVASTNGQITPHGLAYYRDVVTVDASEMFSLVYHVIPATKRMIGGLDDTQLTDRYGRPIYLIEGFVLSSTLGEELGGISQWTLSATHAWVAEPYHRFWELTDAVICPSDPIEVVVQRADVSLILERLDPYITSAKATFDWVLDTEAHQTTYVI